MIDTSVHERVSRRAVAAQQLLGIHHSGGLESVATWSWDVLGRLPNWFMVGADERDQLQLICGALLQGASLRLWVRREVILEAHRLLGADRFESLVEGAARLAASDTTDQQYIDNQSSVPTEASQVESLLRHTGAGVLLATIAPALLNDSLREAIGPVAGDVPEPAAWLLLQQAERFTELESAPESSTAAQECPDDRDPYQDVEPGA